MLQKEVEHYDEIFKRLIEVSGDANVDTMVTRFIETEDMNFAMFNYVNEQNMQCKQLQADIERLKVNTSALSNYCGSMSTERKKIYKEVEEKFQKVSTKRVASNKSHKKAKKLLEEGKQSIWGLFTKINDTSHIQSLLGNSEITQENMMQFLGEIERYANELLQIKLLIAVKENNEHDIIQLQAARTDNQSRGQKAPFMPPSVIIDNLESANYTRVAQKTQMNEQKLKPLHEDEALSTATRSLSRLALQQDL